MYKKLKGVIGILLTSMILLTGCGASHTAQEANATTTEKTASENNEPTIITYACTLPEQRDPYRKDPVTGEYLMSDELREVNLKILDKLKEEFNVELQFVEFPGSVREVLLQSVMAGDPLAEIVDLETNSQGVILGQNILQPLDEYVDLIGDNLPPKNYGKQFFMQESTGSLYTLSPLFYNIDYIEQVDALKVDGRTVYPTDLYKAGEWTWSTFEDYLTKINNHFANSQAPERPEYRIDAYRTDYTETLVQAIHSNGSSIYGEEGLQIDTDETKEAVKYVQGLIDKGLLTANIEEGTSSAPWASHAVNFNKGETVFTNLEDWRSGIAAESAAERGQSIGFIPFPRPDHMEMDDPNYRQVSTGGGSTGILKGVPEEKIPLIIQAYKFYESEFNKALQELDPKPEKYTPLQIDIFHPEIGADMLDIYCESVERTRVNEISLMSNIYWDFMKIAGDALYGVDGSGSFDNAIESKKYIIEDKVAEVEALLNQTEARDNIAPKFEEVTPGTTYAIPVGTDPTTIDWAKNFTATDNVDGVLDMANAQFDTALIDFNTVGEYEEGLIVTIKDTSDNLGKGKYHVVVYDNTNKEAPTLKIKESYRTIKVNEDISQINWYKDFIETAIDKDHLNLESRIVVDITQLDSTTKGKYNLEISVTDYNGNESKADLELTVE